MEKRDNDVIPIHRKDLNNLKARIEELKAEIARLDMDAITQEEEIAELKAHIKDLKQELENALNAADDWRLEGMVFEIQKRRIAELEEKNARLKKVLIDHHSICPLFLMRRLMEIMGKP